MTEIGLVHLVRERNGIEPFRRFLLSYKQHPAGIDHGLLILYKGFTDGRIALEHKKILHGIPHQELFVSDKGLDLYAYRLAAEHFAFKKLCFLNSFSVILDDGWLNKLYTGSILPNVGICGATGSYESMLTNLANSTSSTFNLLNPFRRLTNRLLFEPFPNPHIRTTAFMMERLLMLEIWPKNLTNKPLAYLFESGKNSLAQRIHRRGLISLIVGKDGIGYEVPDWVKSRTFRLSNQENLLVSDNQTSQYQEANEETRRLLTKLSWGI